MRISWRERASLSCCSGKQSGRLGSIGRRAATARNNFAHRPASPLASFRRLSAAAIYFLYTRFYSHCTLSLSVFLLFFFIIVLVVINSPQLPSFNMFSALRPSSRVGLRAVRWNSTTSSSVPPLLATLRSDLKVAMRAKDKSRYAGNGDLLLQLRPV